MFKDKMERQAPRCTPIIADYVNVNHVDDEYSRGPLAWIQTTRGARTGDMLYARNARPQVKS